jgi:N-acylglucosamine-6-phosphate 2-epimerase
MDLQALIASLRGGLIVSCQAMSDEPLFGAQTMAAMARAAFLGGAVAIRANGAEDIAAIRTAVNLPLIGLIKEDIPGFDVRITPTLEHAARIAQAGADVIAIDATRRSRPGGLSVSEMIHQIHRRLDKPVLADISTFDEGVEAAEEGADLVATTLSGYTSYSPSQPGPDFTLLDQLSAGLKTPRPALIAEGRIVTPAEAAEALMRGAHAVVVGSAITRPQWITAQFSAALKEVKDR